MHLLQPHPATSLGTHRQNTTDPIGHWNGTDGLLRSQQANEDQGSLRQLPLQVHLFLTVGGPKQIGALHEEAVIKGPAGNFNAVIAGRVE